MPKRRSEFKRGTKCSLGDLMAECRIGRETVVIDPVTVGSIGASAWDGGTIATARRGQRPLRREAAENRSASERGSALMRPLSPTSWGRARGGGVGSGRAAYAAKAERSSVAAITRVSEVQVAQVQQRGLTEVLLDIPPPPPM